MALTSDVVRHGLRADEPDYDSLAAEWGAEALPFLAALAKSPDRMVGPRACYLAGKIADPGAAAIVEDAAKNLDPFWRLAAAGTAKNLPVIARTRIVSALLTDIDVGVRKFALDSTPDRLDPPLKRILEKTATTDPVDDLRKRAREVLARSRDE